MYFKEVKRPVKEFRIYPLTSWKHPETETYRRRWPDPPPERTLLREIEEKCT